MVRFDGNQGCRSFKPYTAFDSDNGISHMNIPPNGIGTGNGLQALDDLSRAAGGSVEGYGFPFPEFQGYGLGLGGFRWAGVRMVRQGFARAQGFFPPHGGSPQAFIDGILRLFPAVGDAVGLQVFDFGLPRQFFVADGRNDFNTRCQDLEDHIETDLVVSGPRTAVGNVRCPQTVGVVYNFQGLNNAFGTYRERVGIVTKDVAENQVLNYPVVKRPHSVYGGIAGHSQFQGFGLNGF